jgi:phage antirepressor YoqD-like protein
VSKRNSEDLYHPCLYILIQALIKIRETCKDEAARYIAMNALFDWDRDRAIADKKYEQYWEKHNERGL